MEIAPVPGGLIATDTFGRTGCALEMEGPSYIPTLYCGYARQKRKGHYRLALAFVDEAAASGVFADSRTTSMKTFAGSDRYRSRRYTKPSSR